MSKTEFNVFEYYDMLLAGLKVPFLSPTCSFSVHENDIQIDLSEAQYRDNIKKKATFIEIVSQKSVTSRNKTLVEVLGKYQLNNNVTHFFETMIILNGQIVAINDTLSQQIDRQDYE